MTYRSAAVLLASASWLLLATPAGAIPMLLPAVQARCEVAGSVLNTVFVAVGVGFDGPAKGTNMTFRFTNTATGAVLTFVKNTALLDPNGFPIPAGTWTVAVSAPSVGGKAVQLTVPAYTRVGRHCMEMMRRRDPVPGPLGPTPGPGPQPEPKPGPLPH